jgi:hypothetical protein
LAGNTLKKLVPPDLTIGGLEQRQSARAGLDSGGKSRVVSRLSSNSKLAGFGANSVEALPDRV